LKPVKYEIKRGEREMVLSAFD